MSNGKPKITLRNSNARLLCPGDFAKTSTSKVAAINRFSKSNSNTQLMRGNKMLGITPSPVITNQVQQVLARNGGLNSDNNRVAMVDYLEYDKGIRDKRVLNAMVQVQRHFFMDPGMAVRAYKDEALPIGYGQTISMPSVVARMISIAIQDRVAGRVLEIGTGCGYQAAVLACVFKEVHSIERIVGLHELAKRNLAKISNLPKINLVLGDGMLGLPMMAPFDAIVIAAAGLEIPKALLSQLSIGGRLIAPEGGSQQKLVLVERVGAQQWSRTELEETRFVPLLAGIQP